MVASRVRVTVASVARQALVIVAESSVVTGADLSILMPVTLLVAVLPARSAQLPFAERLEPSDASVVESVAFTTPEPPSAQSQATTTSVLFQPAAFGAVR